MSSTHLLQKYLFELREESDAYPISILISVWSRDRWSLGCLLVLEIFLIPDRTLLSRNNYTVTVEQTIGRQWVDVRIKNNLSTETATPLEGFYVLDALTVDHTLVLPQESCDEMIKRLYGHRDGVAYLGSMVARVYVYLQQPRPCSAQHSFLHPKHMTSSRLAIHPSQTLNISHLLNHPPI